MAMDKKRPSSSEEREKEDDKRLRESLPPRKVCIVCRCVSLDSYDVYNIYIIDLNDFGGCNSNESVADADADAFIPRAPTIRIDGVIFSVRAFCVLNSTLYMFEECNDRVTNPEEGGKSVFTLDLSSSSGFNLKLEGNMLGKAPNMLGTKIDPVAIPTPDGKKIVVFSTRIGFVPYHRLRRFIACANNRVDFELYDPNRRSWQKLPGICDGWGEDDKRDTEFNIEAYTFINESVLLLQTWIGMFTLDLDSLDNGWQSLASFHGAPRIPRDVGRFLAIRDGLCLTPFCAYDLEKEDGLSTCFNFPTSSSLGGDYFLQDRAVALLDDADADNGRWDFCTLQTGIHRHTMHPHLIMDVCRCDPRKVGDDFGTGSIVKSFKFLINAVRSDWFFPLYLSPVQLQAATD